MTLDQLFEQFIQEKAYLQNCTPATIEYYRKCFKTYKSVHSEPSIPTKADLNQFVLGVRKRGMSVGCANTYIRGINTFLDWLYKNDLIKEKLRIGFLKQEKKVMRSFNDAELKKLVSYRPRRFSEQRLHTLLCLLIDTGARIDEALSLRRENVYFDNLLIKVKGKGNKERVIPISFELRKLLYRFLSRHNFKLVFPSRDGKKLGYQNTHRDFYQLCRKLNIEPAGFHCLRRTFARNYIRNGGNLFYLQTTMGHTRLETTRVYVEVETEALKETHFRTSILSRLR